MIRAKQTKYRQTLTYFVPYDDHEQNLRNTEIMNVVVLK